MSSNLSPVSLLSPPQTRIHLHPISQIRLSCSGSVIRDSLGSSSFSDAFSPWIDAFLGKDGQETNLCSFPSHLTACFPSRHCPTLQPAWKTKEPANDPGQSLPVTGPLQLRLRERYLFENFIGTLQTSWRFPGRDPC